MAGSVLENLSTKKLIVVLSSLLVLQVVFFAIGGMFAPSPTSYMEFDMIKCRDQKRGQSKSWFHHSNCDYIDHLSEYTPTSFDMREIVFVAKMPHARENVTLEYSPWFQFLLGVLHVDVEYSDHFRYIKDANLLLEVRMGYRKSVNDPWTDLTSSNVSRVLDCSIADGDKKEGNSYTCEPLNLFEFGSSSYPFYLVNIRIPINQAACRYNPKAENCQIGKITGLRLIEIHQNGGFTLVWLWMKTMISPIVIAGVIWFWRRVDNLARKPLLLEKSILFLGVSLVLLDFPLEWISLTTHVPFLLLLSDLRQGLFYTVLLTFWLIFAGEHLVDESERNQLTSYRFNLGFIVVGSGALLTYDLIEKGFQLYNPFHTVWSSEKGTMFAMFIINIGIICTFIYFAFLVHKVVKVWRTIRGKRSAQIYRNSAESRLKTESVIYRFKFLMLFTLLCAGLTITAYYLKQQGEAQLHSDEARDSYLLGSTSAFFTGTFGMVNIYVLLLLAMYAPSHKHYRGATQLLDDDNEVIDDNSTTESNVLTTFLKPSND